jgi:hypothetical protein
MELGVRSVSEFFDDGGRVDFSRLDPAEFAALKRDILLSLAVK